MLRELRSPRNYQVARTVPRNGVGKYATFAKMLNKHCATVMTRTNVPKVIEQELSNMRQAYGKGLAKFSRLKSVRSITKGSCITEIPEIHRVSFWKRFDKVKHVHGKLNPYTASMLNSCSISHPNG
jgi:hypothetical protein